MKKLITIAVAAFMLVSCGNTSGKTNSFLADPMFDTEEYLPGYDVERGLCTTEPGFCESENTYYALPILDPRLFYSDKKTGISGPLCSKLQCDHTGDDCDSADIMPTASSLRIYNGKLYWSSLDKNDNAYIYCANLDGTDRKKVKSIPTERITAMNSCPTFAVHRGYAYYSCISDEVVGGKACERVEIWAEELKKGGESLEIMSVQYDCGLSLCTQLVANKMYIIVSTRSQEDDTDKYGIEIYIWDSKTRTLETSAVTEFSGYVKSMWVVPGKGIYMAKNCNGPAEIYWLDFETKELTLKFDFSEYVKNNCATLGDDITVLAVRSDQSIILSVKDMDGKELLSKVIDEIPDIDGELAGYSIVGIGREALIMYVDCFDNADMNMKNHYVAFSLETGEATVIL